VRPGATEAWCLRSCRSHHVTASRSKVIVTPVFPFYFSLHISCSLALSLLLGETLSDLAALERIKNYSSISVEGSSAETTEGGAKAAATGEEEVMTIELLGERRKRGR
jgi:hypothetical protein